MHSAPTVRHLLYTLLAAVAIILAATSLLRNRAITTTRSTPTVTRNLTTSNMVSADYANAADFQSWNRLATGMSSFHNSFKHRYRTTYDNAAGGFHARGQSLSAFLNEALYLSRSLDMHHRIEEAHIFPLLARRLEQFSPGNSDHVKAHRAIHDGMAKYEAYIHKAQRDPSSYNAKELRDIMDGFEKVLFDHLDQEVEDIGADSLKKAGFKIEELDDFPF